MTDTPLYDGSGKLGDAIAALYGCSPRSNNKISALVGEAKAALGVGKSKKLDADVNRSIWQWHFDRVRPATADTAEVNSQGACLNAVELFSQSIQPDTVDIISQSDSDHSVEINSQPESPLLVDIISQPEHDAPVEVISQIDSREAVEINPCYADTALIRIAFYVQRQGKRVRQVIALDGFYINALMLATGINKADVPKWVQSAVNGWSAFDGELPITRQVKMLLVRELSKAYC